MEKRKRGVWEEMEEHNGGLPTGADGSRREEPGIGTEHRWGGESLKDTLSQQQRRKRERKRRAQLNRRRAKKGQPVFRNRNQFFATRKDG